MSKDLFAQYGINPDVPAEGDLFARYGLNSDIGKKESSLLDKLANNPITDTIIGFGNATVTPFAQAANWITDLPGLNQLPKAQIPQSPESLASTAGQFAGGLAPMGAAMNIGTKALNAVSAISPALQGLTKASLPAHIGRSAAGSAAYEAMMSPENRLGGALAGGAIGAFVPGSIYGINKLMPHNLFGGNLTNEELLQNLMASRGTNTSLAQVTGNPWLNFLTENVFKKIPFGGGREANMTAANQVKNRGNEILNKYLGENDALMFDKQLNESLTDAMFEAQKRSNSRYADIDRMAGEQGLQIGTTNYAKEANRFLDEIKNSKRLSTKLEEREPGLIRDLENASLGGEPESLSATNIFRGEIGKELRDSQSEGRKFASKVYKGLREGIDKDIENAIPRDQNNNLRKAYDEAQRLYREEVVPFEHPVVSKFARGGADAQTLISSFLKTGNSDRSELLNQLMRHIPEEQKGLVPYGYFKNTKGGITPTKMASKFESLGDRQKEILFNTPEKLNEMNDYARLVRMNEKPLLYKGMFSPETGKIAADFAPAAIIGGLGAGLGHLTGLIGSLGTSALASRAILKYLHSEKIRENLVNKMINRKGYEMRIENPYFNTTIDVPLTSAALSAMNTR